MKKAKISVIVPVFNIEQYLPKCVQSICDQTYENLEIILVDDGSTDGCRAICDDFAARDNRILVIHQSNGGLVSARKSGLKRARGEYIGFVDGDDYIEPDMYSRLYEILQAAGADFVHSGYLLNDEPPRRSGDFHILEKLTQAEKARLIGNNVLTGIDSEVYNGGISPSIWSKLYKSEFIKKCYSCVPERQQYGEDLISLCQCVMDSQKFAVSDMAYYHYNERIGSMSHKQDRRQILKEFSLNICLSKIFENSSIQSCMNEHLTERLERKMVDHIRLHCDGYLDGPYRLRNIEHVRGKRILLYGAGQVGQSFYLQLSRYMDCKIVGWIDTYPHKYNFYYANISPPQKIASFDFDCIVIAVLRKAMANQIKETLIGQGIEPGVILWEEPIRIGD